jgi:hypothetical protein
MASDTTCGASFLTQTSVKSTSARSRTTVGRRRRWRWERPQTAPRETPATTQRVQRLR